MRVAGRLSATGHLLALSSWKDLIIAVGRIYPTNSFPCLPAAFLPYLARICSVSIRDGSDTEGIRNIYGIDRGGIRVICEDGLRETGVGRERP